MIIKKLNSLNSFLYDLGEGARFSDLQIGI
jgi:hypothetical protein